MTDIRYLLEQVIDDLEFVDWACEKKGQFRFIMYTGMEALENDIQDLELGIRPYNSLKRAGYNTIKAVAMDFDRRGDFVKLRNMGRCGADEVMLKLFLYTYENLKPEKRKAYLEKVRGLN